MILDELHKLPISVFLLKQLTSSLIKTIFLLLFLMPGPLVLAACHKKKLESQIPPLTGQPLNKVGKDRLDGLRIASLALFFTGVTDP